MTTRRRFLAGSAAGMAGLGALAAAAPAHADATIVVGSQAFSDGGPSRGLGIKASILALGNLGYFRPDLGRKDALGILDLDSGTWNTVGAATSGGHIAMPVADGGLALISKYGEGIEIKDKALASRKLLKHPDLTILGHGYTSGKSIWVTAERVELAKQDAPRKGPGTEGVLQEVDLETMEFGRQISSGAIHPHDLLPLPNGKVVVSHYGATFAAQKAESTVDRQMFDLEEPCLVVLDIPSGKVEKKITLPKDGAATHLALGGDGRVYVVPLQYDLFAEIDGLETATPTGVILRQDEWKSRRLGLNLPIRAVDLESGTWEDFDLGVSMQRRGQSIAANALTGKVFATFPYSDTLWGFDPKTGQASARRSFDFGIRGIRGVCDIPGTSFIAIAGETEGVVVVDAKSMKVVARYAMPTFWTVHLAARA